MVMELNKQSYGYYHVTIRHNKHGRLLYSNNERAYIVSQLQDLLSPRLLIVEVPPYTQLASCIDLLAFSIRASEIQLVLFAIDKQIAHDFIQILIHRLLQYQSECTPSASIKDLSNTLIQFKRLTGPHQALTATTTLHILHEHWEYDRYSSIGFYLHDRRGDWMRTWRLTQLYDNTVEQYQALITHTAEQSTRHTIATTGLQFAA